MNSPFAGELLSYIKKFTVRLDQALLKPTAESKIKEPVIHVFSSTVRTQCTGCHCLIYANGPETMVYM